MKRKVAVLLLFIELFLIVGCGYTKEEKALMEQYEKTAKTNAVDYIKEKYGFTAKVTGTKVLKVNPGPVPDFSPSPTGFVDVSMEYEDIEFVVNITGEEQSTDGKDSYQKTEIDNAFKESLEKKLGISLESVDVMYKRDCLMQEKFTDIDSFLALAKDHYVASIVAKTFDEVSKITVEAADYESVELLVISCRNQDGFDLLSNFEYLNNQKYRENFYNVDSIDRKLSEYSIFMNGYVYRDKEGEAYCRQYKVEKVEDGVYLVYDKNEGSTNTRIAETKDMAPAYDWSRDAGKVKEYPTFENPEQISKSYAVEFDGVSRVQVYMKPEKRAKDDKAQRYMALQYIDDEGQEIFTHKAITMVEGLYYVGLEYKDGHEDMKIAVMINKKK